MVVVVRVNGGRVWFSDIAIVPIILNLVVIKHVDPGKVYGGILARVPAWRCVDLLVFVSVMLDGRAELQRHIDVDEISQEKHERRYGQIIQLRVHLGKQFNSVNPEWVGEWIVRKIRLDTACRPEVEMH